MTVGEGLNVDALMDGVRGVDPGALIDSVLQQVLQRLLSEGVLAGTTGAESPQDLLAEAIGGWLTGMLGPDSDERPGPADWDELLDRNSAMAAAVGACECWGEDRDCAFCDGQGTPGWVRPDRELFAEYVDPAVRWMSTSTTSETANGDDGHDAD